jgi:DNA replication and repair protein RecF
MVKGDFNDSVNNSVRVTYSNDTNKKGLFIDDKQMYRASALIGKFPVVTLTLSDHSNTFGSPGDRRKFVDSVISQSNITYLDLLLEYNKTLRQRSSLLNQIRERGDRALLSELDTWTSVMIELGTELVKHRIDFVAEFNGFLKNAYYYIMGSDEVPEIYYAFYGETDKEKINDVYSENYNKEKENELRRGLNLIGPHRDEYYFKINDFELRKFGSQGQHKTFQIALRFAEFFYLKEKSNKTPIFLMDDIFGELDANRSRKISSYLSDIGQAFVTLTDLANIGFLNFGSRDKKMLVEGGKVSSA